MTVEYRVQDGIAVALVDRPPVNAIDVSVRAGLLNSVARAIEDSTVQALLVACRGRTFASGADLAELGSTIPPPGYLETLAALETCPKPVIAALHGTALGGGLETAMACHYRIAIDSARMGMPEITLGIIPGAGGTQRLPRLVGPEAALDLLLQGGPIDAHRALELGLLDEIAAGDDPVKAGLDYTRKLLGAGAKPRPTREQRARLGTLGPDKVAALLERHARPLKGRTTQHLLIRAIDAASTLPFDDGLRLEAELSTESLRSAESRALRHVFFAERECARIPGIDAAKTPPIKRAVVIGAGTMGSGIAMSLSDAGIETLLVEREPAALERGLKAIRENYAGSVQRGRLNAAAADERLQRIRGLLESKDAGQCDLAIEAVFENFDLKKSVLGQLDSILPPHAILASNTSSLSLTALARATRRPDRVIGLHFFSPANVMRLLEIVRGEQTSQETILAGLALAKTLRKIGVVVGDGFGFVGNRMMLDGYFREVDLMLLQGVVPSRIDAVMEKFGFAMGPNRVNDMAGVDVGTRVRTELANREFRDPPYHVVSDTLTSLGRLGQKSGRGVYSYAPGDRAPKEDADLPGIIRSLAEKHGIAPREVTDREIEERCVLALINIGANILAEGLAYRASDIDVVWTSGYGFPRWRGGPMHYADELGLATVLETIRQLAGTGAPSYWTPAPLLAELAASGRRFSDWDRSCSS